MGEPIATVAGADAIACASGDASERVGIARCVVADEVFLQRPSLETSGWIRELCRARHNPRYVECRIMWSCVVATTTGPDGGGRGRAAVRLPH